MAADSLGFLCTPGVCCWAFGELIINLGDCLGTILLHERLTSTTLPWNSLASQPYFCARGKIRLACETNRGTALIAYNTFGTHECEVAVFVYQQQ